MASATGTIPNRAEHWSLMVENRPPAPGTTHPGEALDRRCQASRDKQLRIGKLKIAAYVVFDTTSDYSDQEGAPEGAPKIVRSVLVLGLFVLLAFGVLAFGTVDEWSSFTFEAGAGALFLVWAGKQFVSRQMKLSKN